MAKLTIVVTIYNIENYIRKGLDALLNQTCDDFEVLCVNDGSSDNSKEIILEYVNKDKRFKLLDKENGGSSTARNLGIDKCNSEYISFIDGDDFISNDYVEIALKEMESKKLDLLMFGYNQYYLANDTYERIHLKIKDGVYKLKEHKELLAYLVNAPWNKIYKTSIFKDNDIRFQVGYRHQDYGTMPKLLLKANTIESLDKPLYNYVADIPNNVSSKADKKLYDIITMSDDIVKFFKKENEFDDYINELEYLVKRNYILALRKAMKINDKKFVLKFIDDIFNSEDSYFKNNKYTYKLTEENGDNVYLNRFKTKMYYLLKGVK